MRLTKLSLVSVLSVGCTSLSASFLSVCLYKRRFVDVCRRYVHRKWFKCCCPQGDRRCLMSFHGRESHGCHFIPRFYLFSSCSPAWPFFFFFFGLLLFPLMAPSLGFFLCRKCMNTFCCEVRFFVWPLLGDGGWSVVCAACCHVTLVFAIMHLAFVYVHSK